MNDKDFEKIYLEYYGYVYGFLRKITSGDEELSKELTQETFFQAFMSIGRFRGNCPVGTWLCAISKNCWLKYLRKNSAAILPFPAEISENAEFSENTDISRNPEELFIVSEEKTRLRKAILDLPKKQQTVMILRLYYDMSYEEIEKATGIKRSAAKVIFQRGKNIIIERIKNP